MYVISLCIHQPRHLSDEKWRILISTMVKILTVLVCLTSPLPPHKQIYHPINKMLNCWIFDGELIDNSLEFFIACDESSKLEKLWKSKYSIRQGMLPSFISKELAQKV